MGPYILKATRQTELYAR